MKIKKKIISIIVFSIVLILNCANVFAYPMSMHKVYNRISLIISIIMKLIILILFASYLIFGIVCMVKHKKDKNIIKELIKWLVIIIIALVLWFSSEFVKEIGMTIVVY